MKVFFTEVWKGHGVIKISKHVSYGKKPIHKILINRLKYVEIVNSHYLFDRKYRFLYIKNVVASSCLWCAVKNVSEHKQLEMRNCALFFNKVTSVQVLSHWIYNSSNVLAKAVKKNFTLVRMRSLFRHFVRFGS